MALFNDTTESVLLNDPQYIRICENIEELVNRLDDEDIEQLDNNSSIFAGFVPLQYSSVIEVSDSIDRALAEFSDDYDELVSGELGDIIDIVSTN